MIDSVKACLPTAVLARDTLAAACRADLAEASPDFALLTLHRPSNVDDPKILGDLLETNCWPVFADPDRAEGESPPRGRAARSATSSAPDTAGQASVHSAGTQPPAWPAPMRRIRVRPA